MDVKPLNEGRALIDSMLKDRVQEVLDHMEEADLDRKIGALAKLSGVSSSAVSQWQSGLTKSMGPKAAFAIEKRLGYRAEWLMIGKFPKRTTNVRSARVKGVVPLISWVVASLWGDVSDPYQPGEADEWAEAYETVPGESAFALRVVGDSMTSSSGPHSFPEGTILIVDPSRGSDAGDFVIAKDVSTQRATFKRLVTDGNRWYLQPLNPNWDRIEIDDPSMRVIGRVVEWKSGGKL